MYPQNKRIAFVFEVDFCLFFLKIKGFLDIHRTAGIVTTTKNLMLNAKNANALCNL